jgi:hypothetical protein
MVTIVTNEQLAMILTILLLLSIVSAFQVQPPRSSGIESPSTIPNNNKNKDINIDIDIDIDIDYSIIQRGGIFIQPNWINTQQIDALRQDIHHLRSSSTSTSTSTNSSNQNKQQINNSVFIPSGLSNRVDGDNNIFGKSDRLTCTITSDLPQEKNGIQVHENGTSIRNEMDDKLHQLAHDLSKQLSISLSPATRKISNASTNRNTNTNASFPTYKKILSLEEQYYSISPPGSLLPRHMDERHEETKGEMGWISESRRSISWLLYLSDEDIEGGELRAYVRHCKGPFCGSHEGNIQVGWLGSDCDIGGRDKDGRDGHDDDDGHELYDPVFLDCWVKTPIDEDLNDDNEVEDEDQRQWQPLYSLYRIRNNHTKNNENDNTKDDGNDNGNKIVEEEREYLSNPFGPHSPGWPQTMDLEPDKFGKALATQLFTPFCDLFISTEQIHDHPMLILPTAGTLVLFDSVAIPHEVLTVLNGERLALAGWFHEPQQDFPDWYGT